MLLQTDIDIARQIVPDNAQQAAALDRLITHAMRGFLVDNQAAHSAMQMLRLRPYAGDVVRMQEDQTIGDAIQGLLSKQDMLASQVAALTAANQE
jgi:hypothetical protein